MRGLQLHVQRYFWKNRGNQTSLTWEGGWVPFNPHWAHTSHEGSYSVELTDIWRNITWAYYLRSAGNNWFVQLPHRHEHTCTEQVTGHIKQICTEQFTHRVRVLREELLGPEWKSISHLNTHLKFWREIHYLHAGNERDRPFWCTPPGFVRTSVGGTHFAHGFWGSNLWVQ